MRARRTGSLESIVTIQGSRDTNDTSIQRRWGRIEMRDVQCDYCRQYLDDGEELTPIFVGGSDDGFEIQGAGKKRKPTSGETKSREIEMLGGRYKGMRDALSDLDSQLDVVDIDVNTNAKIAVTRRTELEAMKADMHNREPRSKKRRTIDGVSISVSYDGNEDVREPDMEVCEICTAEFKLEDRS